jgi:hypothetical protein
MVEQRVKIFAGQSGKSELQSSHVQNVLLALSVCQIGIQKVITQLSSRILQISHAKSADRLNNIGFDGT